MLYYALLAIGLNLLERLRCYSATFGQIQMLQMFTIQSEKQHAIVANALARP
jgi:hypothetical protein